MTSRRMRLVSLASVPPNATLAHDVHIPGVDGPPLLRRGVHLTDRYVNALKGKGIVSIFVEDELSEGVVPQRAIVASHTHRPKSAYPFEMQ